MAREMGIHDYTTIIAVDGFVGAGASARVLILYFDHKFCSSDGRHKLISFIVRKMCKTTSCYFSICLLMVARVTNMKTKIH